MVVCTKRAIEDRGDEDERRREHGLLLPAKR